MSYYNNSGYGRQSGGYGRQSGGYSVAEKRAYYRGQGYKAAENEKAFDYSNRPDLKKSFVNGYRGLKIDKMPPNKRAKQSK